MTLHIDNPQQLLVEAHRRLRQRIEEQGGPAPLPVRVVDEQKRARSLQTAHRYAAVQPSNKKAPPDNGAYVPELSARLDSDPNLSDGARRCARKLAEETYRANREGRTLPVTVTYLARALGRCRRTVQRYLRQLEREGYVAVEVVASRRSRMCVGLVVRILQPLLAAHHRDRWPGRLGKPGATQESQNKRLDRFSPIEGDRLSVEQWAIRCMDGVLRSFMKTNPLAGLPPVIPA
ncbi:HTH crp-type domain-containing protein [Hyphomicrobiales bacterium]|nr:HTH crp-type domain-containing protein [Hyphomicrobiales bacterium]CAH1698697.1 HTH crp-type domain-containing protein [Hyphomicrobiales bacterium]CAI0342343.1 HTH crp-type domain-containing protein [Hyphomicrobiales bacterium]